MTSKIKPFSGAIFQPWSLKYEPLEEGYVSTSLKKPEKFSFVDYSRGGLRQSRNGIIYIRMESQSENESEEMKNTGLPGIHSAAQWITDVCSTFYKLNQAYIFKNLDINIPAKDVSLNIESGLLDLNDQKDEFFKKFFVFYPSVKYSRFYNLQNGKEMMTYSNAMIEIKDLRDSFFRVDLSIKNIQIRYVDMEKRIIIRCFVNVPSLTCLQERIDGLPEIEIDMSDKRSNETLGLLATLQKNKKRKILE